MAAITAHAPDTSLGQRLRQRASRWLTPLGAAGRARRRAHRQRLARLRAAPPPLLTITREELTDAVQEGWR